jgi:hypothetical protein
MDVTFRSALVQSRDASIDISRVIGCLKHAKMSHNESGAKTQSYAADCGVTSAAVHPLASGFFYMAWPFL